MRADSRVMEILRGRGEYVRGEGVRYRTGRWYMCRTKRENSEVRDELISAGCRNNQIRLVGVY
jgi:hypothetical protein